MNPYVIEARSWDYLRESTPNHGLRVEAIQHMAGGQPGDSWCMELAWVIIDRVWKGAELVPREQSVQSFREFAKAQGWEISYAHSLPGDFVISVDDNDHGHHIGIETQFLPLKTIAGNTSEDGTSSNGTGCFEHEVAPTDKEFYRLPLPALAA